jgi:adenine phosphoribosyltransferase
VTADAAIDYRGISNTLRLERAALSPGDAVLLVDDWIETGNQARAAMGLIEACGAGLIGVATVVRQASPDAVQGWARCTRSSRRPS